MLTMLAALALAAEQPSATACSAVGDQAAALVIIRGLRAPTGLLVLYLYGDDPNAFLQHARSLQRIELPVTSLAPGPVCLVAPRPGRYAVSVRHDVDGNRRRIDMSDGGGFSRNPRLSLLHLRPELGDVLIRLDRGVTPVEIVLNYRFGLTVRPVAR